MNDLETQVKNIFTEMDKSSWEKHVFGDIAFNISERIEPSLTDAEIYVGLEHLDSDSIHIKRHGVPSDVKGTKLKVYKGDIIFGKRRAYQRKAAVAEFDGICSAHAMVLRANPEVVNEKFFPFFIHSGTFMTRALEVSEGSLSPTIKWNTLKKEEFRLPPLELQKKLSDLLWKADDLELKYLKTALDLDLLLQSTFKEKFSVSDGTKTLLADIADINPRLEKNDASYSGEVDFIPMDSVSEDGEVYIEQKKDFQKSKSALTSFKTSDILFAKITPCMENGKGCIVPKLSSPVGLGSTEFHILRAKEETDTLFIYYLTKLPFFRELAERRMTGSAGQKRVPVDFLQKFEFKAPNKKEREKLGNLCNSIWTEKKTCEKQAQVIQLLKSRLIDSIL